MSKDSSKPTDRIDSMIATIKGAYGANEKLANKMLLATIPNQVEDSQFQHTLNVIAAAPPKYADLNRKVLGAMNGLRDMHTDPRAQTYTEMYLAERLASPKVPSK
jgi:hypothetical protein